MIMGLSSFLNNRLKAKRIRKHAKRINKIVIAYLNNKNANPMAISDFFDEYAKIVNTFTGQG